MGTLQPRHGVVVAAEHRRGGRQQLEILWVERLPRMGVLEALARLEPGSRRVGLTAPLELDGPIHRAARHCAANVNAALRGSPIARRRSA
jgi:hypothetical protein